jgi:hypothetical protein
VAIIAVLGLLAAAWFDGGARTVRSMSEVVVLPEIRL